MKKSLIIITIIELILLAVFGFRAFGITENLYNDDLSLENAESGYMAWQEGSWYIDDSMLDDDRDVLYTMPVALKKGTYNVTIDYSADKKKGKDHTLRIDSSTARFLIKCKPFIKSEKILLLDKNAPSMTFPLELNGDVKDLEFIFGYGGDGDLRIDRIEILQTPYAGRRSFAGLIILLTILDLAYVFRRWIYERRLEITSVIIMLFVISIPVFTEGVYIGDDTIFHLNRIDGVAEALRHGDFPARFFSDIYGGNPYPSSIMYGDVFLYPAALLRIAGFAVTESYKAYVLLINLLTVVLSYISFKGIERIICKDKVKSGSFIPMAVTAAYVSGFYRLTDVYVRGAVGEYTALAFLPLTAYGMYRIFDEGMNGAEEKNGKEVKGKNGKSVKVSVPVSSIILAAGVSGIIQSHVLSMLMSGLFLGVSFIIACVFLLTGEEKKTKLFSVIKSIAVAVFITLTVNAAFIIPFLDYYKNVPMKVSGNGVTDLLFNQTGADLGEMFSIFHTSGADTWIGMISPGLLLLAAPFIWIILRVLTCGKREGAKDSSIESLHIFKKLPCGSFEALMVLISLWISSDLFPWGEIIYLPVLGSLASVQFGWRFLGIVGLFLSLLFLRNLIEIKELFENERLAGINIHSCKCISFAAPFMIMVFSVITACSFAGDILPLYPERMVTSTTMLKEYMGDVGMGEYLRDNIKREEFGLIEDIEWGTDSGSAEGIEILSVSRGSTSFEITCRAREDSYILLPFLNYKGFYCVDDKGNDIGVTDGDRDRMKLKIPSGFEGTVYTDFKEPVYWRGAEAVSLLSLAALMFL